MWIPTEFETREALLDFHESGQGKKTVHQLFIDETLFANAIEQTSWDGDSFQTIVCEGCGHECCESGNWLSIRRSGRYALFIPDFEAMLDEDDREEYAPPESIRAKGALCLDQDALARLRQHVPDVPDLDQLKDLSGEEAKRLLQLEAFDDVLGEFPDKIEVRRDLAITSSEGELEEILDTLEASIDLLADHRPVKLSPLDENIEPVIVFLDDKRLTEWKPLAFKDGTPRLLFLPNIVVESE